MLRTDLHLEVYGAITILSHIAELEVNGQFQEWMFAFIQGIRRNKGPSDWAQFMSDSIHEFVVNPSGKFYMFSYVIYVCAVKANIQGLNTIGILGIGLGENPVYAYYPQLR